ncbi:xanthine dehydrogenase family protein molybdopterin-binding subunit [Candidatus Clostridium radicumherbarum]|uniref:Xanthine dehydrogenase family protein molybdopterin-binding subunit n=1 Tax=Candidatus Clostridium radicumherbarum TaxID=3381662 RepID=A0ABW8TNU0_9CLOT
MRAVGEGFIRPDAFDKVLGKAVYPDDIEFEGMLYAGVKRSTIAYGKVLSINTEEIKKLPGVEAVIDYSMLPGADSHGVIFKDIPILVKDTVKRVGDALVLVVAKDKQSLAAALKSVKVEYEEYKGIFTIEDALKEDASILGDGSNILYDIKVKTGDVEEGFKEAAYVAENWYSTQMVEHAFLQPEACVAKYDETGVMEIYVATQYPHYDREEVSRCLKLTEDKVRIINTSIGGAFGAREDINPQCHAAVAAYITKKPIKIVYSREESTTSHSKRHPVKMYYKTGVRSDGKLCALKARIYGDTGAYASWGMNILRKSAMHATGPYVIPNVDVEAMAIYTNNPFCGAMRGFGAAQVPIAYEGQMDILAEKLGMHPLKFRHMNAFEVGSVTASGQCLKSSVALKKCIEKVAEIDGIDL